MQTPTTVDEWMAAAEQYAAMAGDHLWLNPSEDEGQRFFDQSKALSNFQFN